MAVILRADDDALTHTELDANFTSLLPQVNGQIVIGNTASARSPTIGTLTEGTGLAITNGAGSITIALDYAGTDNFIDSATNLEGTDIATGDTIVYHDANDNNVKKGLVSDLPFNDYSHPTQTAIDTNATNNGINVIDRVQVNTLGHVTSVSTRDLSSASASASGVVNTTTQTFGGAKTFNSAVTISDSTASTSTTTGALTVAGGVGVAGALYATSKSFDIPHPTKEGMGLRHGSLEGPEFGVYVRGKTTEQVINLPDYWVGLVDESTITVQLTAIDHPQQLWVKKIENNQVHIRSVDQINCYYHIFAERKDIDKLEVEYE